jgi:hypothetical protein
LPANAANPFVATNSTKAASDFPPINSVVTITKPWWVMGPVSRELWARNPYPFPIDVDITTIECTPNTTFCMGMGMILPPHSERYVMGFQCEDESENWTDPTKCDVKFNWLATRA